MEQLRSKKSGIFPEQTLSIGCSACRKSRACAEGDGNDEARMTNDEGMTNAYSSARGEGAFWGEATLVREESRNERAYDLEERTARFGESIIKFANTIPQKPTTNRIISQLVGATTSVGANYLEADDSVSKKEFLKCIGTCKKEARETKHFLRMAVCAEPNLRPDAKILWQEARELHLIFAKIWRSGRNESAK
jgi:four helix bundle protein